MNAFYDKNVAAVYCLFCCAFAWYNLSRKTLVAAGAVVTSVGMDTQKCLLAGCPASVKKRYE